MKSITIQFVFILSDEHIRGYKIDMAQLKYEF